MLPGLQYEILEGDSASLAAWQETYTSAVTTLAERVASLTVELEMNLSSRD
jgi:hypothetical protein